MLSAGVVGRAVWVVFVLVGLFVASVAQAQPKRMWKRDGHSASPRVLGLDATRKYLYTESAGALYLWDTDGDTVIRRLLVSGTDYRERSREHVYLVDDTTLFVEHGVSPGPDSTVFRHLDDGHIIRLATDNTFDWVDPGVNVAVTWSDQYKTNIIIHNPRTFAVTGMRSWDGDARFSSFDPLRKVIYGYNQYIAFEIDTQGVRTDIAHFKVYVKDVQPMNDGTVLIAKNPSQEVLTTLVLVDPVSKKQLDSVSIARWLSNRDNTPALYPMSSDKVVVITRVPSLVVLERNPLRVVAEVPIPPTDRRMFVAAPDSLFFCTLEGAVMLFNPTTSELKEVIPARAEVKSATQLNDGRLLVGHMLNVPLTLDVKTGNDLSPLWPNGHPWVVFGGKSMHVIAAKSAPVVATCRDLNCRLLSTTDTTTQCVLSGNAKARMTKMAPAWVDSTGKEMTVFFEYNGAIAGSMSWGIGFHRSTADCTSDSVIAKKRAPDIRDELLGTVNIPSVSLSADGRSGLYATSWGKYSADSIVYVFKDLSGTPPYSSVVTQYSPGGTACFLPDGDSIVMNDQEGVSIISATDTELFKIVRLGQHHFPVAALHHSNQVITFASNRLHCVDLTTQRVLWSTPVTARPFDIVVDRDDDWFVALYNEDYIEMFTIDTVVAVESESGINQVVVFPNPASETLNVQAPFPIVEYALYDVLGCKVLSALLSNAPTSATIDVRGLVGGAYVLCITGRNSTQSVFVRKAL